VLKRLTHSKDGKRYPRVGVKFGREAFSIPERHVFIELPFGFQFFLTVAVECDIHRYKLLANGDYVPYNELVAPDDWRDQIFRPDGTRW